MAVTQKGYAKLLKHHGLDPDKSTDSDVDQKISNSMDADEVADLENRAKEGDKAREKLADETVEKYKNRIGDKPETKKFYREALLSNRDETLKVLDALPAPTTVAARAKPLHNRATAETPEAIEKTAEEQTKNTKKTALLRNRAEKHMKDGIAPTTAWIKAEEEVDAELAAGMHK